MARLVTTACLFVCLWGLSGCTVYGQKPVKTLADATGGEGLERALWKDIRNKDWKDVGKHAASNFVYTSADARLDRAAALAEFARIDLKDYSISDLTTELNGTVFVVSYTISLQGTIDGRPILAKPQRRMTVWHQQKSGWMMIAHAVTEVANAPAS